MRGLTSILLFAGLTRAAYLLEFRASDPFYSVLLPDASRYHSWGEALAAGRMFEPGPFYQAPLYPWLVGALYALFGAHALAVYATQMALGLASILLIGRAAARVGGERAGLAAAALASLYGVYLFNETRLLPGSLGVFLMALSIERLQVAATRARARDWASAGLVLGLGALANPGVLLAVVGVLSWLLLERRTSPRARFRRAAPMLAVVALVVAPVTLRNAVVGGDAVLISANGGVTFHQGNSHASFLSGGGYGLLPGFSGDVRKQRDESRRIAAERLGRPLADSEVSSYWFGEGLRYIREHPREYLQLQWRRLTLAQDSYEHALEYNAQVDPSLARLLTPLPFGVIVGLAALRLMAGRVRRVEAPVLVLLGAQTALLFLFFVSGRYRLPLTVPLLVSSGIGVSALLETRGPRRAAGLGLFAAASLTSLLALRAARPALYTTQEGRALAERAWAFYELGRIPEATVLYRRALDLDPRMIPGEHLELARRLIESAPDAGPPALRR